MCLDPTRNARVRPGSNLHAVGVAAELWKTGGENHSKKMHRIGKVSAMRNRNKARFQSIAITA